MKKLLIGGMIISIILLGFLFVYIQSPLKPSEVAENMREGQYETLDTVTIRGFCCDQMMGTSLLIYSFTDGYEDYKCVGEGIDILSNTTVLTTGKYYTIEIMYLPTDCVGYPSWRLLEIREGENL